MLNSKQRLQKLDAIKMAIYMAGVLDLKNPVVDPVGLDSAAI